MTRIVTLGNGRRVRLGDYVAGIRRAIDNPDQPFKHGLCGWWEVTGAEVRREFRASIHDRINSGIPYSQRGRASE